MLEQKIDLTLGKILEVQASGGRYKIIFDIYCNKAINVFQDM